jgi:hypothetical protein
MTSTVGGWKKVIWINCKYCSPPFLKLLRELRLVKISPTEENTSLTEKYEGVSKSFRIESITKYMLTFGITHWEATQRVMAAKLTRLPHKIAIQLHLMAESYTISSSRSRRPVRKLLDTPSYTHKHTGIYQTPESENCFVH